MRLNVWLMAAQKAAETGNVTCMQLLHTEGGIRSALTESRNN